MPYLQRVAGPLGMGRYPSEELACRLLDSPSRKLSAKIQICQVIREHLTVIRQASNLSLPLSGVVANPQARDSYVSSRQVLTSPLETITPVESVEAEISRLTWAVIDGIATPADRERLAELVSHQHKFRRL